MEVMAEKILEAGFIPENMEEEETAGMDSSKRHSTSQTAIVSTIGYLIGVRKESFREDGNMKLSRFNELELDKNAKTIRCLCILRTQIERGFKKIWEKMRISHSTIWSMPDRVDVDALMFLREAGVNIPVKNVTFPGDHVIEINKHIQGRIENVRHLIPDALKWEYVKDLFVMPNGITRDGAQAEADKYYASLSSYPYRLYTHWRKEPVWNSLFTDRDFVIALYEDHDDHFDNMTAVCGVSEEVVTTINEFVDSAGKVDVVVDCENADPYKLSAAFRTLGDEVLRKIHRILLVDDPNTVMAWKVFNLFVPGAEIRHIENQRVLETKSLVDIRLTAEVCGEYYRDNVDSFILVSSDSDFCGLINAMQNDVRFLIMLEHDNSSFQWKTILREKGIFYAYLDKFYTGNCEDIKKTAVMLDLESEVKKRAVSLNLLDLYEEILHKTQVGFSDSEKENFWRRYIETVKMRVDADGSIVFDFKRIS